VSATHHTVHVRVNDAATGQPTPVRIRFTGPDGEYLAPFGRLVDFATQRGEDVGGNLHLRNGRYAYIDGSCEIRLPAGPVRVVISKGPEYTPLCQELTLAPGKLTLRFELRRWINWRDEGWYSGDVRAHYLTPHGALLEAAAEDLAVVNLLALQDARSDLSGKVQSQLPNILAFSGQRPVLELPGCLVVVNTYNIHPVLGQIALLNCHRPVYPLRFGEAQGWDNWTVSDWCDQCHRKGGLVVWTAAGTMDSLHEHGEALANLIRGKVDAFETNGLECEAVELYTPLWYDLLNAGLQVPLVGASTKESNHQALGEPRTYARLQPGEAFTYKTWIEAVRAGRTCVTNGPLLSLTAQGHDPGAVLDLLAPPQTIHVRAEARSLMPFELLQLVLNGAVVATAPAQGSPATAVLEQDVPVAASGWLAARCACRPWEHPDYNPTSVPEEPSAFAQTSPVYVRLQGCPPRADRKAVANLLARLDASLEWVSGHGRFENEPQRHRLVEILQSARQELIRRQAV
jgi:hypothetical protein